MKKIFTIALLLFASLALTAQTTNVTYTADNATVFPNPERGYTVQFDKVVTEAEPRIITVSDSWFSGDEKDNIRLCLYLSYLNNFRSQDLPDAILNAFDEDMAVLRSHGWKCVLRFAYANTDNNDATLSWVQRHLQQLKPHLAANADVIYVMEAGFVGKYGEWYYSANYGDATQHMNADRIAVVDALLANAPTDRFILLRTPMAKTEYLAAKEISTAAVTSAEAFTGATKARLGHHNDAFLADYGDAGTYASNAHSNDPAVRAYIVAETLYVPNGGETNVTDATKAEARYAYAPDSMNMFHWSFCGNSYAEAVTNRWRTHGQYTTQNIYMGYRYNLINGEFPTTATAGSTMAVTINIKNVGYAPIYNERPVYLVLKKGNKTRSVLLSADPRRWTPSNETIYTINETVALPSDLYAGTWHLYLHMPDKYSSIAADPRYAVRCGNRLPGGDDVWNAAIGMNDLGADVVVSGPDDPAPEDPIGPDDPEAEVTNALSAAFASASPGDVIYLSNGIYKETSSINFNKNITIKASAGASPVIKSPGYLKISSGAKVVFEGLKFDASVIGDAYHLMYAYDASSDNRLILENCELYGFANNSSAIYCSANDKLDYLVINNCKFYNNHKSCIFLANESPAVVSITNSSFYNISTEISAYSAGVVDIRATSGRVRVDHCTFYDCDVMSYDYGAIRLAQSTGIITNNILVMSTAHDRRAIHVPNGSEVIKCITYNYTKDNGIRTGDYPNYVQKSTCIQADPLFADAANNDFTLGHTSPAIRFADDGSHAGDPRWWPINTGIQITIPSYGMMTYIAPHALDFSGISGLKAYVATSADAGGVTMTEVGSVPAGTPLVLVGTAEATYSVPVIFGADAPAVNLLRRGDECTVFDGTTPDYILYSDNMFYQIGSGTVAINKAYLHLDVAPSAASGLRIVLQPEGATHIENVEHNAEVIKFIENGQFFIRKNGIVYDALGRVIK